MQVGVLDRGGWPKVGGIVPPMAVNATHPDYDAGAVEWARARDVFAGEDAVKAGGERYLPWLAYVVLSGSLFVLGALFLVGWKYREELRAKS